MIKLLKVEFDPRIVRSEPTKPEKGPLPAIRHVAADITQNLLKSI